LNAVLPLLHVTQTVAEAGPGVFAVLGVLACAIVLGAGAGIVTRLRRSARRRLAVAAVFALALLAVLPSVLPYDHLLTAAHTDDAASVHASHCHDTPSSCADAPVTSGPGQLIDASPLVVVPALMSVLLVASTLALTGISRRPALRPPLLSVASI
jgi:hypothetical protein